VYLRVLSVGALPPGSPHGERAFLDVFYVAFGVPNSTRDFERQRKEGSGNEASLSLYASSARGTCRKGSFTGDPGGYITRRHRKRASVFIGDPSGNLEVGSFTGDFER